MSSTIEPEQVANAAVDATSEEGLDELFAALANPVRRTIVRRLALGPATVNDLAAPLDVSLPAVSRHLRVLERAGLIHQTREGQRRPCHLIPARLGDLENWAAMARHTWPDRLDRLDLHLGRHSPTDGPDRGSTTAQETPT